MKTVKNQDTWLQNVFWQKASRLSSKILREKNILFCRHEQPFVAIEKQIKQQLFY